MSENLTPVEKIVNIAKFISEVRRIKNESPQLNFFDVIKEATKAAEK